MADLLPGALARIDKIYQQHSDLILLAWPTLVGARLASLTQPLSFVEGVLLVKVKNSIIYSLLNQHEKTRILHLLRQKFPHVEIKTICFRMS
jgi:hypothetical protein